MINININIKIFYFTFFGLQVRKNIINFAV